MTSDETETKTKTKHLEKKNQQQHCDNNNKLILIYIYFYNCWVRGGGGSWKCEKYVVLFKNDIFIKSLKQLSSFTYSLYVLHFLLNQRAVNAHPPWDEHFLSAVAPVSTWKCHFKMLKSCKAANCALVGTVL